MWLLWMLNITSFCQGFLSSLHCLEVLILFCHLFRQWQKIVISLFQFFYESTISVRLTAILIINIIWLIKTSKDIPLTKQCIPVLASRMQCGSPGRGLRDTAPVKSLKVGIAVCSTFFLTSFYFID